MADLSKMIAVAAAVGGSGGGSGGDSDLEVLIFEGTETQDGITITSWDKTPYEVENIEKPISAFMTIDGSALLFLNRTATTEFQANIIMDSPKQIIQITVWGDSNTWRGSYKLIPIGTVTDVQVNGTSVVSSGVASVSVPDISGCEVTSNKVTSLSNASTDTQYPSAKCVYDELQNIPTLPTVTSADEGKMLIVNSSGQWVSKTIRLPFAYQEVEYIESSGTQFIDTLFNPTSDFKIVTELEMPTLTGTDNFLLFGSYANSSGTCYFVGGYNGQYFVQYGSTTASFFTNTSFSSKTTITYDNGQIEITDGVTTESKNLSAQSHSASTTSMYLFAGHNVSNPPPYIQGLSSYKLYSFKIWNGSALVRHFVPCYNKTTNDIGLFDLVNYKFYGNNGTGTFTKGADV